MGSETVFDMLNKKGVTEALSLLQNLWKDWKKGDRETDATTFEAIRNTLHMNTRTLTVALGTLVELEFTRKDGRRYRITDLGLLVCPWVEKIKAIPIERRETPRVITFDVKKDHRSWFREAVPMIIGASKEVLITTRQLKTFLDPEVEETAFSTFKEATKNQVKIRIIADPSLPKTVRDIFKDDFHAEIKYLPADILENPPSILRPIFLEDFGHVMITDANHWLYLFPHTKEMEHTGKRGTDDPIIATYLREIFETFWSMAKA